MAMQYKLPGTINNEQFGVEIIPIEEFLKDSQAKNDFYKLLMELVEDENEYRKTTHLTLNGIYTPESTFSTAKEWDKIYFVLDGQNHRIGCCQTNYDTRFATIHVGCVVITKLFRGRGLGNMLMNRVVEDHPGQDLTLTVSAGNPRGIKFYQDKGFTVTDYKMVLVAKAK